MAYLIAYKARPALKDKFRNKEPYHKDKCIPALVERYLDTTELQYTLWEGDIEVLCRRLKEDLEDEEERGELLEYLKEYSPSTELEDVERILNFLETCMSNGYILYEWI